MTSDGYSILPGLINAHDHLEFNLFPRLGRGPYPNSEVWARDICHPDCSPVREHLSGAQKRPLVVGWSEEPSVGRDDSLPPQSSTICCLMTDSLSVLSALRLGSFEWFSATTSLVLSMRQKRTCRSSFIWGEGTDKGSQDEVFALDRKRCLDSRTILVHGVAFTVCLVTLFGNSVGAGLVGADVKPIHAWRHWTPDSFLV